MKVLGTRVLIAFITLTIITGFGVLDATQTGPNAQNSNQQEKKEGDSQEREKQPELKYEVTVTATGVKKETFKIPKPVSIVPESVIDTKAPNNITELMAELPGLDTVGVGANQSRPVIRGLRGQRILLMENGIRMNNSRRQQDFGEIPALVDISEVSRVEVVRGPASVLYGSDAIGGVVNVITRMPDFDPSGNEIHGNLGYRYSSADSQNKGFANFNGHVGRLGFTISGNYRDSQAYDAPAGSFGNIELSDDTLVNDTGVQDQGLNLALNYKLTTDSNITFKYEYYKASDAGFGYVDPDIYDPGSALIRILYPNQQVDKYTLRYEDNALNFLLADHMNFTAYHRRNKRDLEMNITIPFNIPWAPEAGMNMQSANFTDINTFGFRLEFRKVAFSDHVITYGVDFFNDNSFNTDQNTTTISGFGPPMTSVDNTPELPNAGYRSFGFFIQDDLPIAKRTNLIIGIRYQNVNARTKETSGLEDYEPISSTDQTVVGAVNLIQGITDNFNLFASAGRGFRSPNLIERFYHGFTPEGSAFQSRNPDLEAETSFNLDLGFKYRLRNAYVEASYFWNTIYDGIRVGPTGAIVNGLPEYQNTNIDKLRIQGVELQGRLMLNNGISLAANFTKITSKDIGNPDIPYTDTFSSKFNLSARYDQPSGLLWVEYTLRINGDQKDVVLGDNPIGDIIPGFTVHNASFGVNLFRKSATPMRVGIIVANLTNELYSEFANASFFRPAPKRQVILTWSMGF
jgi:hemoglobin/transferrin/lactoferrin receptor protein